MKWNNLRFLIEIGMHSCKLTQGEGPYAGAEANMRHGRVFAVAREHGGPMNYAGPISAAEFRLGAALGVNVKSSWDNAGLAVRMCWPWLVLFTAVELAARLAPGFPLSMALQPAGGSDPVLVALLLALKLIAGSSIGVNWSRFLLLGEVASGWDRLRVDRPVWRFATNALLIWFACSGVILLGAIVTFIALPVAVEFAGVGLPPFPRELPLAGGLQNPWLLIIGASMLAGVLAGLPVVQRLSIKLVAVAMGREDYGLGDAWRDSGGQPLALASFTFAITALIFTAWFAALALAAQFAGSGALGLIAGAAAASAASGLTVILATASVSVLFGMFVEGREV